MNDSFAKVLYYFVFSKLFGSFFTLCKPRNFGFNSHAPHGVHDATIVSIHTPTWGATIGRVERGSFTLTLLDPVPFCK